MARIANYNRPKDTGRTFKQMFGYVWGHDLEMHAVSFLM